MHCSILFIFVVLGVCAASNGNCSDICTDVNGTAVCSCKPGFRLGSDNKTCAGKVKREKIFTCI